MMMNAMFKNERTVCSVVKATYDYNYQPGGNLLIVVGNGTGRAQEMGSDKYGRFFWKTMRGAG